MISNSKPKPKQDDDEKRLLNYPQIQINRKKVEDLDKIFIIGEL